MGCLWRNQNIILVEVFSLWAACIFLWRICWNVYFVWVCFLIFWIRNDYLVIKLKQYPLPNKKVIRKMRYRYGWRAVIPALIKLLICLSFFIISIWGYFQVTIIINNNINVIESESNVPLVCN